RHPSSASGGRSPGSLLFCGAEAFLPRFQNAADPGGGGSPPQEPWQGRLRGGDAGGNLGNSGRADGARRSGGPAGGMGDGTAVLLCQSAVSPGAGGIAAYGENPG